MREIIAIFSSVNAHNPCNSAEILYILREGVAGIMKLGTDAC